MSQYVLDSHTATQLACLLVPFIQQSALKSQVLSRARMSSAYTSHCRSPSYTLYKALNSYLIKLMMFSLSLGNEFKLVKNETSVVDVRMAERSKALRSGRSLHL